MRYVDVLTTRRSSAFSELLNHPNFAVRLLSGPEIWKLVPISGRPLAIIDSVPSGMSGMQICRKLRQDPCFANSYIMVASESDELREIFMKKEGLIDECLASGLSDAAIQDAVLSKLQSSEEFGYNRHLCAGELCVDRVSHRVTISRLPVHLSLPEFCLLNFFLQNPETPFSRNEIKQVLRRDIATADYVVSKLIEKLNSKLLAQGASSRFRTIFGFGYEFQPACRQAGTGSMQAFC